MTNRGGAGNGQKQAGIKIPAKAIKRCKAAKYEQRDSADHTITF